MKPLKIILAGAAASLSLAGCNSAGDALKSESQIAQENAAAEAAKAAAEDARDLEIATRIENNCMTAQGEDLPVKLTWSRELTPEMNQYVIRTNERCVRNARGQFFAISYKTEVLNEIAAGIAAAQKTGIESRKDVVYPTRDSVVAQLRAARR